MGCQRGDTFNGKNITEYTINGKLGCASIRIYQTPEYTMRRIVVDILCFFMLLVTSPSPHCVLLNIAK